MRQYPKDLSCHWQQLVENHLSKQIGCTKTQARMLLVLHTYRIISYEIAETLGLGEASKMKERVLRPLANDGWIRFYEGSFRTHKMGPPSTAWSIRPDCEQKLASEIETAMAKARRCEMKVTQLHDALTQEFPEFKRSS